MNIAKEYQNLYKAVRSQNTQVSIELDELKSAINNVKYMVDDLYNSFIDYSDDFEEIENADIDGTYDTLADKCWEEVHICNEYGKALELILSRLIDVQNAITYISY